ncbi:MAG: isoamylase [Spirochaetaceae bacterium]|nr:isoamylase [Spirochaetaceae bacterium]
MDLESYEFIDKLLSITSPQEPQVFEDSVIFTASSAYKKVGIAFSHEGFAKIYPFKKLLVPIDDAPYFDEKSNKEVERLRDSGLLFFVYTVPQSLKGIEYRLVFDGLWSSDPYNPFRKFNVNTGIEHSIAPVPARPELAQNDDEPFDGVVFSYRSESSGEHITVAGDFNSWDPFMYELKETRRGLYTLAVPLPPGTWRYIYYRNGQKLINYSNTSREYAKDGSAVNVAVVN